MFQYFQLTPDILLEYVYNGDPKIDGNIKDIYDDYPTMMLKSNAFNSKYLCFKNESEGLESISNLVLPLNNTETQFVVVKNKQQRFYKKVNASNRFSTKNGIEYLYEDTNYDKTIIENSDSNSCDVKYDKCIVHFTSRNYFGNYDSLIFQSYVYMKNKAKLYFASFLFKKTSNLEMKAEHMLYNEKLYTTQIEFDIPSVFAILSKDKNVYNEEFNSALKSQNIELLDNTPIGINLYGVSGSTIGTDNYVRLNALKINSISIPYTYNSLSEIYIDISEAHDEGDFYYIDPCVGGGYSSFVDYMESMGEDIRAYMVTHELKLKENWVDNNGVLHSEITHKEFHIIDINDDDEDEEISKRFDAKIKYRPICTKSGEGCSATIIDTLKIINTIDSTQYEVTGTVDITNPNKYGMRLKKLELNPNRPIVNVYNKNTSSSRYGSGNSSSSIGAGSNSSGYDDSPLGTVSGGFKGTVSGFDSGESGSGSISGNVSGNIPGFGKVTGSINSKITNLIKNSDSGDFTIEGPINISLAGSSYGSGGSMGSGNSGNGGVIVLNKNGGFMVENMTQNITSFIECTNVGVSILELSPDDIN